MEPESKWVARLRKRATLIAGVLGIALSGLGAELGLDSIYGVLSLGVGSSVIAASLYTMISEFRETFAERLLEQGLVDLFHSRLRRFEDNFWPGLIDSSRDHFRVLGVANHGYMNSEDARQASRTAFIGAVQRGVEIHVLWLDPDSSLAAERERQEGRATRRDIVDAITWFWRLRSDLDQNLQAKMHLLEHAAMPSCGLTWADDQLVVTHYIAGQNNLDSPGMILSTSALGVWRPLARQASRSRRAALAQAYMNTYQEVRAAATELTEPRVEELGGKREGWDTGRPSEGDLRDGVAGGEAA